MSSVAQSPGQDSTGSRWLSASLASVALAWILSQLVWKVVLAWPFSTDDAYIPLRYARHWAAGEGILWNLGQAPVEGYSSFTYLAIATGAIKLGVDPMLAMKVVGFLSLVGACILLWFIARIWVGPVLACLPPLIFSSLWGTVWWAVSGLETLFFVLLSLTSTWLFFRGYRDIAAVVHGSERDPRAAWTMACAGVAACLTGMTRPDGPIVAVALLFLGVLSLWLTSLGLDKKGPTYRQLTRIGVNKLAIFTLAFGVPFVVYFAWRLDYFGRFFSNTVYCKHHPAFTDLALLKDYGRIAWPLALCSLPLLRRKLFDARFVYMLLLPLAYATLLINASQIIGYQHRHVLMPYALLTLTATAGIGSLLAELRRWLPIKSLVVEGVVLVALAIFMFVRAADMPEKMKQHAENYRDRMEARAAAARWVNQRADEADLIATPDTGIIAYLARSRVLDTMCLNCTEATRPPISLNLPRYALFVLQAKPRYMITVADSKHRNKSGWAMGVLVRVPFFHQWYREVAFFTTRDREFNFAVYERLKRPRPFKQAYPACRPPKPL